MSKANRSERIFYAMKNMKAFKKEYFMYSYARFMGYYCRAKN